MLSRKINLMKVFQWKEKNNLIAPIGKRKKVLKKNSSVPREHLKKKTFVC